jgi:soluble lytic murein transglycosylase
VLQWFRKRWWVALIVIVAIAGLTAFAFFYSEVFPDAEQETANAQAKTEAPPDLAKLRDAYTSGLQALQRDDGAEAVRHFSSFDFGDRAVEEYRLYYLANGHQLAGNESAARTTLAQLWRRTPRMIYANDAAFHLAGLYQSSGDWRHCAETFASLARRTDVPAVAAAARWNAARARLVVGDVGGALYAARNIVIYNPRSNEAKQAIALVRALTGTTDKDPLPLTPSERLDRAEALLASGDPQNAFDELTVLAPSAPQLAMQISLQRGIALNQLHRYEDSNKLLEPLTSGPFKYAVPALRYAAKNYAVVAASIDPNVTKVVKEKKKVGNVKVRVGKGKKKKTVTKPKFQIVNRTIKLVDLAKKNKKDEYDRLASERLKDLLQLPIDENLRFDVLSALAERAQSKNQDDFVRQLVAQIVKLDANADPALQHLWDKAWAAYARGDLAAAKSGFRFIADTYTHPNVRRQSDYWYARTIERLGQKEEAKAIYQKLAAAPYADLYAIQAVSRGATRTENTSNPLEKKGDDWGEIAEKQMPAELRLAYELSALSSMRESYLEVRRNENRKNMRFAESLLADFYNQNGDKVLMYRAVRKAWPQIATAEQDSAPVYFLRMYYPIRYGEEIEKYAAENKLDPNLVRALILQESYYNPGARSGVGATGLMQLMPATAKDHAGRLHIAFAASRLENPKVNIELGTFHLRMLVDMFRGNTYLAVASYNAGQGNVLKWRRAAPGKPIDEFLESIPFPETRNYVKRVTMLRSSYARMTK